MALLIWLGLYPQPILNTSGASMQALQRLYASAETGIRPTPAAREAP